MAPRRKKGGARAGKKEGFRVGDLVLAKVKGFAAWPAKISRPEDWKRLPDPKRYFVRFFGTAEIGFVAPPNIKLFTVELKNQLTNRPRIKHSKDFARAVEEICQAFDELQSKSSEPEHIEHEALAESSEAIGSPSNGKSRIAEREETNLNVKEETQDKSIGNSIETKVKDTVVRRDSDSSCSSEEGDTKDENLVDSSSNKDEKVDDAVEEKAFRYRRRKKNVSTRDSIKTSELTKVEGAGMNLISECISSPEDSVKRGNIMSSSSVKDAKRVDLVEEKAVRILRTKKKVSVVDPIQNKVKDAGSILKSKRSRSSVERIFRGGNLTYSSSVKEEKITDPFEEKTVGVRQRNKKLSAGDTIEITVQTKVKDASANLKSEGSSSSGEGITKGGNLAYSSAIKDDKSIDLVEEKAVQIQQRKKKLSAEDLIESTVQTKVKDVSPNPKSEHSGSSVEGITKGENITYSSPVKDEQRIDPVEEKTVEIQRRKKKLSPGDPIETSAQIKVKDAITDLKSERSSSSEEGIAKREFFTYSSSIKDEETDNLVEEKTAQIEQKRNQVAAEDPKLQARKRKINGVASDLLQPSKKRASKRTEACQRKDKDAVSPTRSVEDKKAGEDALSSLPIISPSHSCRPLIQIEDNKNDEDTVESSVHEMEEARETEADLNNLITTKKAPTHKILKSSPQQNLLQTKEKRTEGHPKPPAFQDIKSRKSEMIAENKIKAAAKASAKATNQGSTSLSNRQKQKPFMPVNEKQREKLLPKETLSTKGFDPLHDHPNVSAALKSKFTDSATSMKDLIAVAQAKRKESHSLLDNFTTSSMSFHAGVRERSPGQLLVSSAAVPPVIDILGDVSEVYGPVSPVDNIGSNNPVLTSDAKHAEIDGDEAEAVAAREVFEAMIESLCRTKESIGRTTHQAMECAKFNMTNEVVDLLIRRLETEVSFRRRVDLLFLVDSITQCSHSRRNVAGASYIPSVQASLSRLLSAAAPPGAGACENRHQCVKVLKLWLERKIFPESVLRPIIDGVEVPLDGPSSGLYLRRRGRTERSIDDPIREMEGMLVDEYGSNVAFQLPGLLSINDSEDEEDDLPHGLSDDGKGESVVDPVSPLEERNVFSDTSSKREHHIRQDVNGELGMEDLEKNKLTYVADVPPLPSCPPPSPPPLPPSSPPPPPPLPPLPMPTQPSFVPPLPPNPPPVAYHAPAHLPYSSAAHQDHFRPPNGPNPQFMMPGVGLNQIPQCNVRPCDYGQKEMHLPPHGYHPNMQYHSAGQPIAHVPHPPHVVQQPPPQHQNLIPPAPPTNFPLQTMPVAQQHAQGHNGPYFLPPHPAAQIPAGNPPVQPVAEGQWPGYMPNAFPDGQHGSWAPGWRPGASPGAPLVQDGRFNPNLEMPPHGFQPPVGPVGSIPVPPVHVGPQIFPFRPDVPLNCWRPS